MAFVDVIAAAFATDATVGAIAAGVAAIGTDMSVVGAITGNKTLTEVGGVMGLAGGAVGLATGMIGGAADTAAVGSDAASSSAGFDAPVFSNPDAAAVVPDPGAAASQSAIASQANSAATDTAFNQAADSQAANAAMPNGGLDATAQGAATGATANDVGATQTNATGASGNIGSIQTNAPSASNSTGATSNDLMNGTKTYNPGADAQAAYANMPNGGLTPPPDTSPSGWQNWYTSQPPQVKAALVQGGMGMLGGLFSGWTQEQKLALAKQQQNFAQQQWTTAMGNASAQPTVAAYKPAQPAATGLLNSVAQSNV